MKSGKLMRLIRQSFVIVVFMPARIRWMFLIISRRLIPDIAKSSWMQTNRRIMIASASGNVSALKLKSDYLALFPQA